MNPADILSGSDLLPFYKTHLRDHVLPFWIPLIDREYGGIFNRVTQDGKIVSTEKYLWSQGRALWVFSALHSDFDGDPQWLEIAHGIAGFLKSNNPGSGHLWPFILDRDGTMKEPASSIYVDAFVAYGLTEYARATGDSESVNIARAIYHNTSPRLEDHSQLETQPHPIPDNLQSHGVLMIFALVYHDLGMLTGDVEILNRALELAERIMTQHVKPEDELLYEYVQPGGSLANSDAIHTFIPGHAIESMWFMERIYAHHNRQDRISQAMDVIRWNLEKGWDSTHGGLYQACHCKGGPPLWHQPSFKVWWPHTEALYALLVARKYPACEWALDWYNRIHHYTFEKFPDWENGDWHHYLDREGQPVTNPLARLAVKDPFHLPRALIYAIKLLSLASPK